MKTNKKRLLVYSFLLLFIMACRAYRCTDEYAFKDDGPQQHSLTCTDFIQTGEPQNPIGGLECSMECPGIGNYKFDIFNLNVDFSELTKAEAQAMYCPAPQASSVVTEEPTEPPTEEPAPTEPPTADPAEETLKPYLAGTVTACDAYLRYVNFPVNPDAPAGPPNVIFSGTTVDCSLVNNGTILSCNYPEGLPFPFQVVALINDQPVNNFAFDGAICTTAAPQGPQGAQGSEGSVGEPGPAACDPNQPGTPCFCVLNPSDESCNK